MTEETKPVSVTIFEKEYIVACREDERESLMAAVEHLNRQMQELRDSGKIIGSERIAVLAALNITHEYLDYQRNNEALTDRVYDGIERMNSKIRTALARGHDLSMSNAR
ncbi:MAG: cell division protein ZapA [Gammaproteobacteria bacterium]|nr:cell division protein ZapA [Gammaproteobacteria bacterium]